MILRVLTSRGLNYLPPKSVKHSTKNSILCLALSFSKLQVKDKKKNVRSVDDNIFDSDYLQKYLNYISKKKSDAKYSPEETLRIFRLLEKKKEMEEELKSLEKMPSEGDEELEKLIESDKNQCLESLQQVKNEILHCLTPDNKENDNRSIELKVIAGIGGEEAKTFSRELINMYLNYAKFKNWECTCDPENNYILISGECVFGHLKYEGGVHRVQRVPVTEHSGRVHTSTCSVVILPQPKTHEVQIPEKDLIIERMRSSGPGGQNINKRETCIRVKHIPTGLIIENQTYRHQYDNLKEAINRLRTVLFNMEQKKIMTERKVLAKEQAGTNDYADKIRTYNFTQNRVTDHRINFSIQNLKSFMSGGKELDNFISKVKQSNKNNELFFHLKSIFESVEYKNFEKQQTK